MSTVRQFRRFTKEDPIQDGTTSGHVPFVCFRCDKEADVNDRVWFRHLDGGESYVCTNCVPMVLAAAFSAKEQLNTLAPVPSMPLIEVS